MPEMSDLCYLGKTRLRRLAEVFSVKETHFVQQMSFENIHTLA